MPPSVFAPTYTHATDLEQFRLHRSRVGSREAYPPSSARARASAGPSRGYFEPLGSFEIPDYLGANGPDPMIIASSLGFAVAHDLTQRHTALSGPIKNRIAMDAGLSRPNTPPISLSATSSQSSTNAGG